MFHLSSKQLLKKGGSISTKTRNHEHFFSDERYESLINRSKGMIENSPIGFSPKDFKNENWDVSEIYCASTIGGSELMRKEQFSICLDIGKI